MSDKLVSPNGAYELDLSNSGQVIVYRRDGSVVKELQGSDPAPLPPKPEPSPLPPSPAPAVTDSWPRLGASYYTSLTDPRVDPVEFAHRLRDAGCTYTRVWLIDAWARGASAGTSCYDGFLPWARAYGDGLYDLDGVRDTYLLRLRTYVEAMNDSGILPQLSGWELYSWSDRKRGMLWVPDARFGPFQHNIQGIYYSDDDAFAHIGTGGVHGFLAHFYSEVVRALSGLVYTVELGNEMPEKGLHYRLQALWINAGYAGSISVNRQEDTPGQYKNMGIGRDFDRIAFHGRKDLGYLREDFSDEPAHRTFEHFYNSHDFDAHRIILSSDGCRKSTNPDDAYDYVTLRDVARDALHRGFSYEHQSRIKLRGFTQNRIDLADLETDWLLSLR